MKLLFAILLCVVPVLWDLFIGRIYWKKKTVVMHTITAAVRGLIVIVLSYFNNVELLRSILLSISFHYAFFPPLYNRLIIMQPWYYVGKTALLDRIETWLAQRLSGWFIIWFKVSFLGVGIVYYIHGCLRCW